MRRKYSGRRQLLSCLRRSDSEIRSASFPVCRTRTPFTVTAGISRTRKTKQRDGTYHGSAARVRRQATPEQVLHCSPLARRAITSAKLLGQRRAAECRPVVSPDNAHRHCTRCDADKYSHWHCFSVCLLHRILDWVCGCDLAIGRAVEIGNPLFGFAGVGSIRESDHWSSLAAIFHQSAEGNTRNSRD